MWCIWLEGKKCSKCNYRDEKKFAFFLPLLVRETTSRCMYVKLELSCPPTCHVFSLARIMRRIYFALTVYINTALGDNTIL